MIAGLVHDFTGAKRSLANGLGVESDLLHLPVGMALFGLFCLALRGVAHGPRWALVSVLALQLVNEVLDAVQWLHWTGAIDWREALGDTALTLALPLLLVVAGDVRRGLGAACSR